MNTDAILLFIGFCILGVVSPAAYGKVYHISIEILEEMELRGDDDASVQECYRITFDEASLAWATQEGKMKPDDIFKIKFDESWLTVGIDSVATQGDSIALTGHYHGGTVLYNFFGLNLEVFRGGKGWAQIHYHRGHLCILLSDYQNTQSLLIVYNSRERCYTLRASYED